MGRGDLMAFSTEKLNTQYRVCANHFEDSQFMNPLQKNRLIHNAVPKFITSPVPKRRVVTKQSTAKAGIATQAPPLPEMEQIISRDTLPVFPNGIKSKWVDDEVPGSRDTAISNSAFVKDTVANKCSLAGSVTDRSSNCVTLETVVVRCKLCGFKRRGATAFLQHVLTNHKDTSQNSFNYGIVELESSKNSS